MISWIRIGVVGWMGFAEFALLSMIGCSRKERDVSLPSVASSQKTHSSLMFVDQTERSGVRSVYQNGSDANEYTILEGIGGGVAMIDYDLDGHLDLLFTTGGTIAKDRTMRGLPLSLWRNRGDATFEKVDLLACLPPIEHFSHGIAAADFNNDGFSDLLITGYGGVQLFRNSGDGTFTEVTRLSGIEDRSWSTSAAWFDQNNDGNLDLYITHYVNWSWENHPLCGKPEARDACGPYDFQGLDDSFYLSKGDGTFVDVSRESGLVAEGKGLGVVAADFDLDGRTDLYVANDTTNNFLYMNRGDGKLAETGLLSGTAVDERGIPNGSMGLAVFDFDGDLKLDLWVTNFENETCALYRNEGQGNFRCITNSTGINAIGTLYVSFGTVAVDFDQDGWQDLAIANGHLQNYAPLAQLQLVLQNDRGKRLRKIDFAENTYLGQTHIGRGLVAGDLDGDRRIDLVFSNTLESAAILLNKTDGGKSSLLTLKLVGTVTNRDAIGTTVILETNRGKQIRQICGGGSYLSQNPYTIDWSIPEGVEVNSATILWPGNSPQTLDRVELLHSPIVVQSRPPSE